MSDQLTTIKIRTADREFVFNGCVFQGVDYISRILSFFWEPEDMNVNFNLEHVVYWSTKSASRGAV